MLGFLRPGRFRAFDCGIWMEDETFVDSYRVLARSREEAHRKAQRFVRETEERTGVQCMVREVVEA